MILFADSKTINRLLLIAFAWIQHNAGEVRTIGGIWKMLRLKADGGTTGEGASVGSFETAFKVTGIKLDAGLCSKYLHGTAAGRLSNASGKTKFAYLFLIEHV